jgi:hypothetical protein
MMSVLLFSAGLWVAAGGCAEPHAGSNAAMSNESIVALHASPLRAAAPLDSVEEALFRDAASIAWLYMEANYQPATGFVNATPHWQYTTTWDIGGQILAFLAAKEIGLLEDDEHARRTHRMLQTLEEMDLFRGAAFNKVYSTRDGSIGEGRAGGTGWSATDLGRLLVALHVLSEREPAFAEQARRIVRRMDYDQIVKDGYLHGQIIGSSGQPWSFQEGRIGYEQYVARGFSAWGLPVANALDVRRHARPVEVFGVELLADGREMDRLLSEPFIMLGIELGFPDEDVRALAANVLRAQQARHERTGQITIVSEDAVSVEPHHFYYYCVYCNGREFVVDISSPGANLNEPRWVSTKAAFGWHALMPSDYTRKAVEHVTTARDARLGWASGVYEGTGRSTETFDINTASVLLEVAGYRLRGGRPLIQP